MRKENSMLAHQDTVLFKIENRTLIVSFAIVLLFLCVNFTWAQEHDMSNMPGMTHSETAAQETPAQIAKRLADIRESEFNHHLAGYLVILAGIFLLGEKRLAQRWPSARYVWPCCFLAAGLFLLVYSDTEMWPFGPQSPWYAITHNLEDLQHKTFSVILLALGWVELQRARGRLKSLWAAWFFPVVSIAGSVLLLFHVHSGDMSAPHAMETMEHIQKQHHAFSAVGFGVGLCSAAGEISAMPETWRKVSKVAWPVFLIVLGVLLALYTE
jgi:copper resistance protein D